MELLEGVFVEEDEFLGYGSFCCVKRAVLNGRKCAVKFLQENQMRNRSAFQRFQNERRLLARIRHPHIIGCYGVAKHKKGLEMLVLELMLQDLHSFLATRRSAHIGLPFYKKVDLCIDIAEGLRHLHSQQPTIIHRDLSDTNILISLSSSRAKISDFGMAREIDAGSPPSPNRLTPNPGSSPYMPPEARGRSPRYSTGIDVFAFGVLMLQIDVLLRPNPGPETKEIVLNFSFAKPLIKIVSEKDRRQEHIQLLSADDPLRKIIFQCLEDTQEERPTTTDLCFQLGVVKGSPAYASSYSPQSAEEDMEVVQLREQNAKLKEERDSMEAELLHLRSQMSSLRLSSSLPIGAQHTILSGRPPDAPHNSSTTYIPGSSISQQSSEGTYYFSGASSVSSAGSAAALPAVHHNYFSIYNFNCSSAPPPPHTIICMHHGSCQCSHEGSRLHGTSAGPVGSASPEWYAATRPVMLLGPLKNEVEKMLRRDCPDRYTSCAIYTTAAVVAQRSGEHLYRERSADDLWRLVQEGSLACLSHAGGNIEGIRYGEVSQTLNEGTHCILPESRQLVDSLKRRNIHPLIICIIPNSARTIIDVQHGLRVDDALRSLGQIHELKNVYRDCLTATVSGNTLEDLYSEVRAVIDSNTPGHKRVRVSALL